MPTRKVAVIAIGGNSLILSKDAQTVQDQYRALCVTGKHIVSLVELGYQAVSYTHLDVYKRQVRGTWRFSGEHPLFDEHFPGAPRVPGTLVIEAMRAGAEALFPGWRVLGVKRFRFRHFIEPGAYDYAFTPQPDAAAIRCVLLSGERRLSLIHI